MASYVEWDALGQVVAGGVVIGAGLPALFALGVKALAGPGAVSPEGHRPPVRVAAAVACFSVIVAAVVTAIVLIANSAH